MKVKTLKYPMRMLFQSLLILSIALLANGFVKGKIIWEDYGVYFILICIIELLSIIYLLRNKTYYAIDKSGNKYIINKCKLTSKETSQSSTELITDHYIYDSKTIDVFNLIDLLLSLPSKKERQKQLKNKVLNFPKYQIDKITKKFSFLGIRFYKINLKNKKQKHLLIFNEL